MKAIQLACGHVRGALTVQLGGKGYWCMECGMLQPLEKQVSQEMLDRANDPYVAVSLGGGTHYHELRPGDRTACGALPHTARSDWRMDFPRSIASQNWQPCGRCRNLRGARRASENKEGAK